MCQSAEQSAKVQSVLFEDLFNKPVEVQFDALHQSSDGGALLLGGLDYTLGLSRKMAVALVERRQAGKILHPLEELLRGAVYRLCCGYDDLNDADKLGRDPLFQFLCTYKRQTGTPCDPLASSATVCRWVNQVRPRELLRLGHALMDWQLEHQRRLRDRRVRTVTIDLDPTDDPAYGQQQFIAFNTHYSNYVYLPLLSFVTFHDEHGQEETEQSLVAAVLRPGNAAPIAAARGVLRRLIRRLRETFPGITIRVRLDGGFACPKIYEFLDQQDVKYLINLPPNSVLRAQAEPLMLQARELVERSGQSARVYGHTYYQAGTWPHPKRVIIKAEVLLHAERGTKDNCRFVVTNFSEAVEPERAYKHTYCVRGDVENRIKEIHDVALGRTSCTGFWANQLRVLLAAAAYMLMQELRRRAAGTPLAHAQVGRLRETLLKLGATVREVWRKLYVSLPAACPYAEVWCQMARSLFAPDGVLIE